MPVDVLLGLQWGDEGKGKIVDVLAPHYDIVARFQGGPNAGHTLIFDNKKIVLHTIPSGVAFEHITNVLGNGVVVDPVTFYKEIQQLENNGINPSDKLIISNKSHLILPTHRLLDIAYEMAKERCSIGSTRKGIGPAYTDKYARCGIRMHQIFDSGFKSIFEQKEQEHFALLRNIGVKLESITLDNMSYETYREQWFHGLELLKTFPILPVESFLYDALQHNKRVLAEGAQGAMLDVDFGTYPYVTSSNTTVGGAITGLGIPPQQIRKVFGIIKAYNTRVGNGPFPTELHDETGQKIRELGNEYGSTTGRPRRCGWLDLPSLNYVIKRNGVTDLIITKIDVLNTFDRIKICVQYFHNRTGCNDPVNINSYEPQYVEFRGWKTDIANVVTFEQLPEACKEYVMFIEKHLNTPVSLISNGPNRKQIIFVKKLHFV